MFKNPSYEGTARSFGSLRRQTWCSIITTTHPHQITLQWAGSPQPLLVVYVLQQHSVVPGTTAAAAFVVSGEKNRSYVWILEVRGDRSFRYNQHRHDTPIWHLATSLHDDRDAATLRYRPASRAQWPEQSRELPPQRESYVNYNITTWTRHTYSHQYVRKCNDRLVIHMNTKSFIIIPYSVVHD